MFNKLTTTAVVTSTLFFLIALSVFSSFVYELTQQKAHFMQKEGEHANALTYSKSLKELMRTLNETESDRVSLQTRILKDEDVIELLTLIESLGKEQGTELTTKSLTVEPIDDRFEKLIITVGVKGSYVAVLHVLTLLEYLPYQSSIGAVQINGDENQQWESTYDLRVTKFKKNEN